jgi:hypothetical protein
MVLVFVSPQMRLVLDLDILPTKIWMLAILASLFPLVLIQLYKIVLRNLYSKGIDLKGL